MRRFLSLSNDRLFSSLLFYTFSKPLQQERQLPRTADDNVNFRRLQMSRCFVQGVSGEVSNPKSSSSHSEASRQDSKQRSRRRMENVALSSLSTLSPPSEGQRQASVFRSSGARVDGTLGVKRIVLQDIVGSELHEEGQRQFQRA